MAPHQNFEFDPYLDFLGVLPYFDIKYVVKSPPVYLFLPGESRELMQLQNSAK
jgi:hypothetical protein